ncbi:hypothetical protein KAR91_77130 [Candidatus Pacearchaeota archaeon]|nr:hypothetical protein [Candidatus Pacearchaeota archaeon]
MTYRNGEDKIDQEGKYQTAMQCYSGKGYKYIPCDECLQAGLVVETESCDDMERCLLDVNERRI